MRVHRSVYALIVILPLIGIAAVSANAGVTYEFISPEFTSSYYPVIDGLNLDVLITFASPLANNLSDADESSLVTGWSVNWPIESGDERFGVVISTDADGNVTYAEVSTAEPCYPAFGNCAEGEWNYWSFSGDYSSTDPSADSATLSGSTFMPVDLNEDFTATTNGPTVFQIAGIPEPSTAALGLSGLLLIAIRCRKRSAPQPPACHATPIVSWRLLCVK